MAAHVDPAEDVAATGVRVITPELIEHLIDVGERPAGDFATMGLSGGHDDARLRGFLATRPQYAFHRTATQVQNVTFNGVTVPLSVRVYAQYRWTGAGAAPALADAAQRPPLNFARWTLAQVPKTTVDHLMAMLHEVRQAYRNWHAGNAASVGTESLGQINPAAPGAAATGPSGVNFAGFVRHDPVNALRKLETIFVA